LSDLSKLTKVLAEHPARPDGVAYYARHDDEALCYALKEAERRTDLDQNWFWRLARRYKIGLAPS